MSRIKKAFEGKKAFIGFLTAGDPSLEKTEEYILEMERAGADLIEIGIPFSDPIAEGIVIQEANIRALKNGVNVEQIFEMVERLRKKTEIPLVFLTYINPVYHYGYERFFERAKQTGLDGVIIPDLPFEEKGELKAAAEHNGVDIISLIAPTSQQRIEEIAADASGFIYIVSSMGVTGMRSEIKTDISSILSAIRRVTDKYDVQELKGMIQEHVAYTNSEVGKRILDHFEEYLPKFKKIIPEDYEKMMAAIFQMEEKGLSREKAQIEAFNKIKNGR